MQSGHGVAVAKIHADALAGNFLPSLGVAFLERFYRAVIEEELAFGYVSIEDEQVNGFVLGSIDSSRLFRVVGIKYGVSLGWAALPVIIRKPSTLIKVAETLFYPRKEGFVLERAELVVIAINPERRSQGIGGQLVNALTHAFSMNGIDAYKVTVLQSNDGANRFYRKLGFQLAGEFRLYAFQWNLYIYKDRS
jgi:ribosomal protein S18 acetylase RimI-like enzyme